MIFELDEQKDTIYCTNYLRIIGLTNGKRTKSMDLALSSFVKNQHKTLNVMYKTTKGEENKLNIEWKPTSNPELFYSQNIWSNKLNGDYVESMIEHFKEQYESPFTLKIEIPHILLVTNDKWAKYHVHNKNPNEESTK